MNAPERSSLQIATTQQSTEQSILLNAIKNKFATNNNENQSGTSPPVFSIPNLKLPQFVNDNTKQKSKLDQFILGQLNENKNITNSGAITIPSLNFSSKSNTSTLTLAEKLHLNNTSVETNINSINKGISDLKVHDGNKTNVIDLSTALNKHSNLHHSPKNQTKLPTPNPVDFPIRFIDCDIKEAQLSMIDEDCQMDVSGFRYSDYISAPSRFGKITCLKYRLPRSILRVDHSFIVKHEIPRFSFETKSPDDIIMSALRRFNHI